MLFIRGERPVKDLKYDILKHPNVALTADGKAESYLHGQARDAAYTIALTFDPQLPDDMPEIPDMGYELLSEEDVEAEFKSKEE